MSILMIALLACGVPAVIGCIPAGYQPENARPDGEGNDRGREFAGGSVWKYICISMMMSASLLAWATVSLIIYMAPEYPTYADQEELISMYINLVEEQLVLASLIYLGSFISYILFLKAREFWRKITGQQAPRDEQ